MIRILFIILLIISVSNTQFTPFVHSLTETTTISSFVADEFRSDATKHNTDCTGLNLEFSFPYQRLECYNIIREEHNYIRISYNLACEFEEGQTNTFILTFNNNEIASHTATGPNDNITLRTCDYSEQNLDDLSHSVIVPHNTSEFFELIWTNTVNTNNNKCYMWNVKIDHAIELELEQPEEVEPQVCFDNLGTLTDGEGNTLITNTCDPVDDEGLISFKFTTSFLEPYQYNEECFELDVWFNETQLEKGEAEFDQWTFNSETKSLSWNIKLRDFTDLYNCIDGENEEQLYWICPFTTKLLYDGEVQFEYRSKIQVTVDRIFTDSVEVDIQKNIVEGVCCQNELQVQTDINFCDSLECETFLESPLTTERKQDFFVQVRILNPEFQDYFLKLVEISLGEFVPVVVKQDSSVAGKLTLQLVSHVAKQDLILKVISQLHKTSITRRRMLMSDAEQRLENNEYKIVAYENISVVNQVKASPDSIESNVENKDSQQIKKEEKEEISDQTYQNDFVLLTLIASASVGIFILCLGLVIFFVKRGKDTKEKKENLYLESQEAVLQKV